MKIAVDWNGGVSVIHYCRKHLTKSTIAHGIKQHTETSAPSCTHSVLGQIVIYASTFASLSCPFWICLSNFSICCWHNKNRQCQTFIDTFNKIAVHASHCMHAISLHVHMHFIRWIFSLCSYLPFFFYRSTSSWVVCTQIFLFILYTNLLHICIHWKD